MEETKERLCNHPWVPRLAGGEGMNAVDVHVHHGWRKLDQWFTVTRKPTRAW